jgi:quercetin dioxygenase-like cupin family protein
MRNAAWMILAAGASPLAAQDAPSVKFDTSEARVIESVISPGQRSPLHQQHANHVLIFLDDGRETVTDAQGREQGLRWHAGDVRWSPASGPHASENVGSTPYRVVEVELKNGPGAVPDSALDPVRVDPKHYKVEFENPQVRVLRVRYGPHEAGPVHQHILNRVTVFVTEQRMRVTAEGGKAEMANGTAGEVRMGGAAKHWEENQSSLPFEVAVVELKR